VHLYGVPASAAGYELWASKTRRSLMRALANECVTSDYDPVVVAVCWRLNFKHIARCRVGFSRDPVDRGRWPHSVERDWPVMMMVHYGASRCLLPQALSRQSSWRLPAVETNNNATNLTKRTSTEPRTKNFTHRLQVTSYSHRPSFVARRGAYLKHYVCSGITGRYVQVTKRTHVHICTTDRRQPRDI